MKKLITIMACVICLALVVSVAALGNDINVFESLSSFKYKASEIDTRLDNNLENPEEYQKAMNESLALFNDPQYEKIAEQMVKEQEASREYLKEYVADIKCALIDRRNGYSVVSKPVGKDDAATVEMLDKQIELYEKLEKIVEKADDKSIGELSRKIKDVTQSMKPGKEMPILTNDLSLMIKEADAVK